MLFRSDAFQPNLVQTLHGTPAFIHGGPFANIAHGCNSLMATKAAMHYGDYAVTEAGFGSDLGAEKFLDIKARIGGITPALSVLVVTLQSLRLHGGVKNADLKQPNLNAIKTGVRNLERHIKNMSAFGQQVLVAVAMVSRLISLLVLSQSTYLQLKWIGVLMTQSKSSQ